MKNFLIELCRADFWTKMFFLVALFVLCTWVIMLMHSIIISVLMYLSEGAVIERAIKGIIVFSMLIIIYICTSIIVLYREGIVYFLESAIAIHFFSMIVVLGSLLVSEAIVKILEFIFD